MTAREPSAVEVIAEESRRHETLVCLDYEHSTEGEWCCDCGQHSIKETWPEHFSPRALAALKAAGFVVATREQVTLWHPESPGVRIKVRPCLLRRLGLIRSPFATLGEVLRAYEDGAS